MGGRGARVVGLVPAVGLSGAPAAMAACLPMRGLAHAGTLSSLAPRAADEHVAPAGHGAAAAANPTGTA